MHHSSDDLLAGIKREGMRRRVRRQRRFTALGVVAGALVLSVPLAVLVSRDDDGQQVDVVADGGERADKRAPATTVVPSPTDSPTETTIGEEHVVPVSPGVTPQTTIPATAPCRNSVDPRCGEFHWDPVPAANAPLVMNIEVSDTTPDIGQEVVYTVHWSDADAQLAGSDSTTDDGVLIGPSCSQDQKFGAWTPPAATGGSGTLTFTRTYTEAGAAQESFSLASGSGQCDDPYASAATLNARVDVGPDAPPNPTAY